MTLNMGNTDRNIRALVAILLALAIYLNWITGTLAIILGIVAAVFLVTGIVGLCPLYRVFGISTCKLNTESK